MKKANPYGYNSWTDGAIKVINPDECGFFMVHLSFFKQKNYTAGKKFNRKAFKGIVLGEGSVVLDVIDVVIHSNNKHADYDYWTFWYGTLTHYQNQCDFDLILTDGTVVKCYTETEEVIELLETYRNPISARAEYRKPRSGNNLRYSATSNVKEEVIADCYIRDGVLAKYTGTAAEVVIPNCVKSIRGAAFLDCPSVKSIIIGDNVSSIDFGGIFNCKNLRTVIIGDGLVSIGKAAFQDCGELTNVILGNGLKSIGEAAFARCVKLTDIKLPDGLVSIGKCAFFECKGLSNITIPDSITMIGTGVFTGCVSLKNAIFKGMSYSVKYIGRAKNGYEAYDLPILFYDVVNGKFVIPPLYKSPVAYKPFINDEDWRIANLGVVTNFYEPPDDYKEIREPDYDLYITQDEEELAEIEIEWKREMQEAEEREEQEKEEQEKELHGYGWQRWIEEKRGRGMDNWADDDAY